MSGERRAHFHQFLHHIDFACLSSLTVVANRNHLRKAPQDEEGERMLMHKDTLIAPGAIVDLSAEEVGAVFGGEAPNWAVNGRGPDLRQPSAENVERGANTIAAAAAAFEMRAGNTTAGKIAQGVQVAAQAVAVAASWAKGGDENPGKPDKGKVKQQ